MSAEVRQLIAAIVARTAPTNAGARDRFVWIHAGRGRVHRLEEVTGKSGHFDLADLDEERDERFTCKPGEALTWVASCAVRIKYWLDGDASDHERWMVRIREDGRVLVQALIVAIPEFAGLTRFIKFGPRAEVEFVTEQDGIRAAYLRVPTRYSYVQ